MLTVELGHADIAALLIQNGADVRARETKEESLPITMGGRGNGLARCCERSTGKALNGLMPCSRTNRSNLPAPRGSAPWSRDHVMAMRTKSRPKQTE